MKIIGITGESALEKVRFKYTKNDYQAKVIQSDHVAHELMVPGSKKL